VTEGSPERCAACGASLRADGLFLDPLHDQELYAVGPTPLVEPEPSARPPPGRRRRSLIGTSSVALVVGIASVVALTIDDDADGPARPAGPVVGASTTTTVVLGPLLPERTGLELVVIRGNDSLRHIELDTGHVTEVSTRVGEPFQAIAVEDRVVVVGPTGLWVYPLDGSSQVRRLGPANRIFPSSTPGRVWVERGNAVGAVMLTEIDIHGQEWRTPLELPRYAGVRDVTSSGVLVDISGESWLVDPVDGTGRRLGDGMVLAVHDQTAARFSCERDLRCGLAIGALDGSNSRTVLLPDGTTVDTWGAAFAPDGRSLVVQLFTERPGAFSDLALIDVATARMTGTFEVPSFPPAWSPSGEWLFLAGPEDVVAVHRTGSPVIEILVDGPPPQQVVVFED